MKAFRSLFSLVAVLVTPFALQADPPAAWPILHLSAPREVELSGAPGQALERGLARLGQDPYSTEWLLADVSFKVNRIFTNYSGDVSGRFLELASLTHGRHPLPTLVPVSTTIARYQKPDGHFGVDIDLAKPLAKNSPPIPMLWGNARLLVGLVTAAQELKDPHLLAAARKLGDFYVNTAGQLCTSRREAEYRASGTYGDSYTCCYFPAMEGLAMLSQATKDKRYLEQAQRIAEMFWKFDALPIDHSHGNLCAWRSILLLYESTGDRTYLDRARAKWSAAVKGGFVWPIGGIGEHWYPSYSVDEGCSESDWLRFNLDLWRWTGQTRYLDMAERLLENQYPLNQYVNGGYGCSHFEGDASGPMAIDKAPEEWPFCCSFHGPLGLHFLKAYLAAGSDQGIYVNFPYSFTAPVKAGGAPWRLAVTTTSDPAQGQLKMSIDLAPQQTTSPRPVTLWVRCPSGTSLIGLSRETGDGIELSRPERGYIPISRECKKRERFTLTLQTSRSVEGRRFQAVPLQAGKTVRLRDVSLLRGAKVLTLSRAPSSGRAILLALVDEAGRLTFLKDTQGNDTTVALPSLEAASGQILAALGSGRPLAVQPLPQAWSRHRLALAHDLVVVPEQTIPAAIRTRFAERARETALASSGPFFGSNLETRPGPLAGQPELEIPS